MSPLDPNSRPHVEGKRYRDERDHSKTNLLNKGKKKRVGEDWTNKKGSQLHCVLHKLRMRRKGSAKGLYIDLSKFGNKEKGIIILELATLKRESGIPRGTDLFEEFFRGTWA